MNRNKLIAIGAASALSVGAITGTAYEINNGSSEPGCETASVVGKFICGVAGAPRVALDTTSSTTTTLPNPNATATPRKGDFPVNEIMIDTTSFGRPFAWPVGKPHRSLYYTGHEFTLPCATPTSCHHDGTPAVDIAYADPNQPGAQLHSNATETIGEPVRAITDGVIDNVTEMSKAPGCYSIQFKSDPWPDGRPGEFYWYGHLVDPIVKPGQHIEPGQQLASVGPQTCNPGATEDSYPHLHIDMGIVIDGVPQRAGGHTTDSFGKPCELECRNPELINTMDTLFKELPA